LKMGYRVKLDIFEGPFDLLLYLIRKHEIDIYDIPIHLITKQFLEYLELMKLLDLEIAGEFIEVVAILMNIKARMLLPRPVGVGEDEYEDPRTELVERLIEYKRFKDAAAEMSLQEEKQRLLYPRSYFPRIEVEQEEDPETYLQDISLFDLLLAFKRALDNMPKVTYHEVKRIDVTIEEQTSFIVERLKQRKMILFSELMAEMREKIIIVVTFLALLEMIRAGKIVVRQSDLFDDIRIKSAA
jgi:segregation and condensation protein A